VRIVYFCNNIGYAGGLDRIVIEKANYLSTKHTLYFITTGQENKEYFYDLSINIKHIDYSDYKGFNNIFFSKKKFQRIIANINPDIIIAVTGKESLVLPFFEKSIPKIKEMHFSREHRFIQARNKSFIRKIALRLLDKIEVWSYKKYDKVIPLTYEDEKKWPLDNLQVIYNFKTIESTEKALLKNKNVATVGRLDYQKGFDMLLKAWGIVCIHNRDWVLNIYGDGTLKDELIQLSNELMISNRVIFHGNVKNIKKEYLRSSIYVLSSRHEGLPLVLPEAMECGVPIVSFDCPSGPKDIISNNENGLLIENGNIYLLAKGIEALIYNTEKRIQMGQKASEKAQEFSKDIIMAEWEQLFDTLVLRKGRNDFN